MPEVIRLGSGTTWPPVVLVASVVAPLVVVAPAAPPVPDVPPVTVPPVTVPPVMVPPVTVPPVGVPPVGVPPVGVPPVGVPPVGVPPVGVPPVGVPPVALLSVPDPLVTPPVLDVAASLPPSSELHPTAKDPEIQASTTLANAILILSFLIVLTYRPQRLAATGRRTSLRSCWGAKP